MCVVEEYPIGLVDPFWKDEKEAQEKRLNYAGRQQPSPPAWWFWRLQVKIGIRIFMRFEAVIMVGIEARSSERNQLSTYLIQNSEEVRAVAAATHSQSHNPAKRKKEKKSKKRHFLQRLIWKREWSWDGHAWVSIGFRAVNPQSETDWAITSILEFVCVSILEKSAWKKSNLTWF